MRDVALPQISIMIANFAESPSSWQPALDLADAADRSGIDRVVVSEHVVYGERLDAYGDPALGGMAGGKQPTTPDGHWLDPLTFLTVLATRTTRVRVATSIILAALRTPALLAKQAATIDVLSGGRLDLGVGIGWQREEYDACGVDFSRRGALLDRCLELCQRLWTEPVVDYDDGELRYERIHAMPKPLRPGGVPVWVSGRVNARTVQRVARFGCGWIPWGDDMTDPRPGIEVMRNALTAAGREGSSLQVQGTLPVVRVGGVIDIDATMAGVPALVTAGVTDFRWHHRWGSEIAESERVMTDVVSAFRATVGRLA